MPIMQRESNKELKILMKYNKYKSLILNHKKMKRTNLLNKFKIKEI